MSHEFRSIDSSGTTNNNSEVDELIKCILNRFDQVSVNRIHKIAFLLEHEYSDHTGSRLTDAEYFRVMDGCRSDDISSVIEDLDGVIHQHITIGGEEIHTISREEDLDCDLSVKDTEYFESIADSVVQEFGNISPEEINAIIETVPSYSNTNLGEKIPV